MKQSANDYRYDVDLMSYGYKSKLHYALLHSYTFIMDTFNYMDYLNISDHERAVLDLRNLFDDLDKFKYFNVSTMNHSK